MVNAGNAWTAGLVFRSLARGGAAVRKPSPITTAPASRAHPRGDRTRGIGNSLRRHHSEDEQTPHSTFGRPEFHIRNERGRMVEGPASDREMRARTAITRFALRFSFVLAVRFCDSRRHPTTDREAPSVVLAIPSSAPGPPPSPTASPCPA